jgi:dihydrofolate reductase
MIISLVAAVSENDVIGKDNKLLWNLPNDMKFFKNITWAMPVIMGRKTYEALGKPLSGRTNIVITRSGDFHPEGVVVVSSLDAALKAAADTDAKEAFITGGGQIYKESMPLADRLVVTRVHGTFEGDTWFPKIDEQEWEMTSHLDFPTDAKHAYAYTFQFWKRRGNDEKR